MKKVIKSVLGVLEKVKLSLAAFCMVASVVAARASAYFEVPTEDITQAKTDVSAWVLALCGVGVLLFVARMIYQLSKGRTPR